MRAKYVTDQNIWNHFEDDLKFIVRITFRNGSNQNLPDSEKFGKPLK
jgi:hypothetical protein